MNGILPSGKRSWGLPAGFTHPGMPGLASGWKRSLRDLGGMLHVSLSSLETTSQLLTCRSLFFHLQISKDDLRNFFSVMDKQDLHQRESELKMLFCSWMTAEIMSVCFLNCRTGSNCPAAGSAEKQPVDPHVTCSGMLQRRWINTSIPSLPAKTRRKLWCSCSSPCPDGRFLSGFLSGGQTLTCAGVTCPVLSRQRAASHVPPGAEASHSSAFVSVEVQLDVMTDKSASLLISSCWRLRPPDSAAAPVQCSSVEGIMGRGPREPLLFVPGNDPPTVNPEKD